MLALWRLARQKLLRDRSLPLPMLLHKAGSYLADLLVAPWYLRGIDSRGAGVRAHGKPCIENRGTMALADGVILRSVNAAVCLRTGPDGALRIGAGSSINYGAVIAAAEAVHLGARVRLGPYAFISDAENPEARAQAIVIEDDVWIGAKASILPGVTIGRGAVVATGSVVHQDVPAFAVVAGCPAVIIKRLDAARFVGAC